jgi:hypothetical protein
MCSHRGDAENALRFVTNGHGVRLLCRDCSANTLNARVSYQQGFDIKRCTYRPGDTIVFKTNLNLDLDEVVHIKHAADDIFPGAKVMVLAGGLDMAVCTPHHIKAHT